MNLVVETSYNFRAFINDTTTGFENSSATISFTLDATPPMINLQLPIANNSVYRSDVPIAILIIDGNITFRYNWDTGTNVTEIIGQSLSLPMVDGLHSLEIFACDSVGNWQYAYYEFIVDNTDPIIQPYDVSDGSEVGTDTWITFEVSDNNYEGFWYHWVDEANISTQTVYTTAPVALAPSSSGNWELHVFANDTAGNIANFTVDLQILIAQEITLIYPNGGETVSGLCKITWNSSEDLLYNLYYSSNNGSSWVLLANDINTTFWIWDTTTVNDGTDYLVRVISISPGLPGELHSASVFTVRNLMGLVIDPGTYIFTFNDVTINITISESTNITIQRITEVPSDLQPDPSLYDTTGLFIEIILDNPDSLESMWVSFSYADIEDDLIDQGIDISRLGVYFYNETSEQWELAEDVEIDYDQKLITGFFDHTTVIGVLGRSKASDRGINPIILILLALVTIITAILGAFLINDYRKDRKKKKEKTPTTTKIEKDLSEKTVEKTIEEKEKICNSCNKPVKSSAVFCPYCFKKLL